MNRKHVMENIRKPSVIIRRLQKKREFQIFSERSQGFWIQDQVKVTLDRIKMRTERMKTMQDSRNPLNAAHSNRRKTTLALNRRVSRNSTYRRQILPELKQLINTRHQNQTDELIVAKRRKIIHLLVLGLNRRNLGRLFEALDIILLASFYFQKNDEQFELKTICLRLISRLHREIKQQKQLRFKKKSLYLKKRKSLTVRHYISQDKFMESFMEKLRQSKLLHQSSFSSSKKQKKNSTRINAKCNIIIPTPAEIFYDENIVNYNYVALMVDDQTNMFSYEYPKSLKQQISQAEYRQIICKMNGLLFPQTKCYSWESIIKIFFLPLLLIFLSIIAFTFLRQFISGENLIGRLVLMVSFIVFILCLGLKIKFEEPGYTNFIQIHDKMKYYLGSWEKQYEEKRIKFRMSEQADAIFIIYPIEMNQETESSNSLTEIQEVDQITDSKAGSKAEKSITVESKEGKSQVEKKPKLSRFASTGKQLKQQNEIKEENAAESESSKMQPSDAEQKQNESAIDPTINPKVDEQLSLAPVYEIAEENNGNLSAGTVIQKQ